MADIVDSILTVNLQKQGRSLRNITSYSLESSFMTSTDGFEFVANDPDRTRLRNLELEPVELLLNKNSQILGRIDQTDVGSNGFAVTFRGRDFVSDLVECNVDPTLRIVTGTKLRDAILLACQPCGITSVVGDDAVSMRQIRCGVLMDQKTGQKQEEEASEDVKPKPGEGIYEFINRLCARFGATIQPGPDRRTLVLAAPNYKQDPLYELRRTDAENDSFANNIVAASACRDYSSFPTYTLFNGKTGTSGATKKDIVSAYDMSILASAFNNEMGETIQAHAVAGRRKPGEKINDDKEAPNLYRLLYLRDEESRTAAQLERGARRAISERLKGTLSYRATLRGHQDPKSGALWAVNTMVRVNDEVCGIHETLWIESRKFTFSPDAGSTTEIECWRPSSFEI